MTDAINIQATETLDCSGMFCPMPIYKASFALKKLGPGDVLLVICTDAGSLRDFPAFASQTGNELIGSHSDEGTHSFYLKKGADQ